MSAICKSAYLTASSYVKGGATWVWKHPYKTLGIAVLAIGSIALLAHGVKAGTHVNQRFLYNEAWYRLEGESSIEAARQRVNQADMRCSQAKDHLTNVQTRLWEALDVRKKVQKAMQQGYAPTGSEEVKESSRILANQFLHAEEAYFNSTNARNSALTNQLRATDWGKNQIGAADLIRGHFNSCYTTPLDLNPVSWVDQDSFLSPAIQKVFACAVLRAKQFIHGVQS